MSDEKKYALEQLENRLDEDANQENALSFQNLFAMLVLNWQWFLLSLFICVCGALIYLRYATPSYQVSAKMLIKDEDNRRPTNQMLANMQDFGFLSNSAGIDNEVEILGSRLLARDAVNDLKLYVQYYEFGRISKHVVYGNQSIHVDLDSATLSQWDKELLEGTKSIQMTIAKRNHQYEVKGETMYKGKSQNEFSQTVAKLPATVKTEYGVVTLSQNGANEMEAGTRYLVKILPPMAVATNYAKSISVEPTSKMTSIAEMTLTDQNARRGLDFLRQLAICYNRQANADKNEMMTAAEDDNPPIGKLPSMTPANPYFNRYFCDSAIVAPRR